MHLVLLGATGMVGGAPLRHALKYPKVTIVTVLGRSPLRTSHPKLTALHHENFLHIEERDKSG